MKLPSLLVIDDEPNNFDVIEALLSNSDYQLHYASSGQEAIATLDIFQPDLILLDVMMPGMDGIEACRQIKASPKWQAVPIIMVTALSAKSDLARCLQTGADDFISKPVNAVELRARIQSMLRIKQQYDRIQSLSHVQQTTINLLSDHLQSLRGNLALNLPHEFKTPLNGILGGIALLITDIDRMDAESVRELLNLSYQSACRLENLTERFLNYLDLELATTKQQEQTNYAPISSDARTSSLLIAHIANTIAQQKERTDDLVVQIEEAELAMAQAHLTWIVSELLDNAFKFSQPQTSVTVRSDCRDGMAHLWISDRGRGMTHAQIDSIGAFMQFERRTYEQQGAGLGLKIAQKAVELYGGHFLMTSLYQQETTVYLTLPLALVALETTSKERHQGDAETLMI